MDRQRKDLEGTEEQTLHCRRVRLEKDVSVPYTKETPMTERKTQRNDEINYEKEQDMKRAGLRLVWMRVATLILAVPVTLALGYFR